MAKRQANMGRSKKLEAEEAQRLVRIASKYSAQISLETGGKQVNAKSLMGVMTLGAEGVPEILVRANGADETEAVQAVVRYLETRQG